MRSYGEKSRGLYTWPRRRSPLEPGDRRKKTEKARKSASDHKLLWSASCLRCTHPEVSWNQRCTQIRVHRWRMCTDSILSYQKKGFCLRCVQAGTTIDCGPPDFLGFLAHCAAGSPMPA